MGACMNKWLLSILFFTQTVCCTGQNTYGDAYVAHATEQMVSVKSKQLKTLNCVLTTADGKAIHEMFMLARNCFPGHDFSIVMKNSAVAQFEIYKGGVSDQKQNNDGNCVFCQIAQEQSGTILLKDKYGVAFKKRYPTPTFLVIPTIHIVNIKSLSDTTDYDQVWASMFNVAYKQAGKSYSLTNNNGAASAQTVFHLHFHITPL